MIAISATNPCHVFDLAVALHRQQALRRYYSGYPRWRLRVSPDFPLTARSFRTVITYGLLRVPPRLRPVSQRLFRWQDEGFDRAVAAALDEGNGDNLHGLPGQALHTFRAAKARGWRTVLNHASGPVRQQLELIEAEYRRAGLELRQHHGFDERYFAREAEEYALADRHCAASSIVAAQLEKAGVPREKIWVVPYAADTRIFHRPPAGCHRPPHRIVYAGQLTQRKGLRILFAALRRVRMTSPVELHLYGRVIPDILPDLAGTAAEPWLTLHGAVSQTQLADALRAATLLVLPSWEEAFGLVVPQALNCGAPCIVSDRVGAGDLIQPHVNGSIFPAGDSDALADEISWWIQHRERFESPLLTWDRPAARLRELTAGRSVHA